MSGYLIDSIESTARNDVICLIHDTTRPFGLPAMDKEERWAPVEAENPACGDTTNRINLYTYLNNILLIKGN
jgi:hypothetical protein